MRPRRRAGRPSSDRPVWPLVSTGWHWDTGLLAALGVSVIAYATGWARLRRAGGGAASWPRLAALLGCLAAIVVALLSPLDAFQSTFLFAHMIQHELLMVVAAPLLLLGRPMAIGIWGAPAGVRQAMDRALQSRTLLRRITGRLEAPVVAWFVSTLVLWGWHLPAAYDAAERQPLTHILMHASFFLSGLLFWEPVLGASPSGPLLSRPQRVAYLVAGMGQRGLLGGLLTLSDQVWYAHYRILPHGGALSALGDQRLAGAVMWFGSGLVLLAATLLLI